MGALRYFGTSLSPFRARRSVLSPAAGWPQQPPVAAPAALRPAPGPLPASRYTDNEHLALRAWSSAKLRTAPLAEQVETLMHYPGLEPVYPRMARAALAARLCPELLTQAAATLWAVVGRKHESRLRTRRAMPHLADLLLA